MKAKKGFTLVEILIVVVILGILAAIVIPQFTDASTQAQESSLAADLQTLRSQIELFKVQHGDMFPHLAPACTAATLDVLFQQTDRTGAVYVAGAATGPFGPYMRKMPTNQFNGQDSVNTAGGGTIGDNSHGWEYNPVTANIVPDDDTDNDGVVGPDHALW